jgi:hypothetical protein
VKLNKLIDESRSELKAKVRALTEMSPNFSDMDPYVIKLVLKENAKDERKKQGVIDEEEDEESEDEV